MARQRRMATTAYVDYGPAITRDRKGRPIPAAIAAGLGVQMEDIPDLDRPDTRLTVRVARRGDPLFGIIDIKSRDSADPVRYLAAQKFREDSAIADGIRDGKDLSGVRASGFNGGPTIAMLDAQSRVRAAWIAVRGPENDAIMADVIRLVVLGYATLDALQRAQRCRRETARAKLLEGMDRLATFYGLTSGGGLTYGTR